MEPPFTEQQLTDAIRAALKAWHNPESTSEDLLESLVLIQACRKQLDEDGRPSSLRLATNRVLLDAIEEIEQQDRTAASVLRMRFVDGNTLTFTAGHLNVSEHSVSRLQRIAIQRLGSIVYGREQALRRRVAVRVEALMPPPTYSRLFGTDDQRRQLVAQLLRQGPPWVIALVGIGGIGKTALADGVARAVIGHFRFDDIIWLHAPASPMSGRAGQPDLVYEALTIDLAQRLYPETARHFSADERKVRLRQALKNRPHLIVVDNLESDANIAHLLVRFNDLAQPSKFLLTTRSRPVEQAAVFNYTVDELSLADAGDLLRHHAEDVGVTALAAAGEDTVQDIFNITGGNPLALKLVASLLDALPLPQILAELARGRAGKVEDMYRRIYWQSWQTLSQPARQLLQAMPLVADAGGTPDYLQTLSGLSEAELWPAVQELRARSLLEVRGDLHDKRYSIHRLTETFLHTEITGWDSHD